MLVDGKEYILEDKDCLYIGMGSKEILFKSGVPGEPARFYFNSAPAHATYPTMKLLKKDVQKVNLGKSRELSGRTINQFIIQLMKSCQLVRVRRTRAGSVGRCTHTPDAWRSIHLIYEICGFNSSGERCRDMSTSLMKRRSCDSAKRVDPFRDGESQR